MVKISINDLLCIYCKLTSILRFASIAIKSKIFVICKIRCKIVLKLRLRHLDLQQCAKLSFFLDKFITSQRNEQFETKSNCNLNNEFSVYALKFI